MTGKEESEDGEEGRIPSMSEGEYEDSQGNMIRFSSVKE